MKLLIKEEEIEEATFAVLQLSRHTHGLPIEIRKGIARAVADLAIIKADEVK